MEFNFDTKGIYEVPIIALCNPNRIEIAHITNINNLHIRPRFNAVSEVTFEIRSVYYDTMAGENKQVTYYNLISKNRLLHIQGFGYFIIVQVNETNEGEVPTKEITAYSYEYMLNAKGVNIGNTEGNNIEVNIKVPNSYTELNTNTKETDSKRNGGEYKFYDQRNPEGTLLYELMKVTPIWKIGKVNTTLCNKKRYFEVPTNSLYSFLMEDVEKAYECIFTFDTEKLEINAYTAEELVKDTDISLSFDNLIKNVKIEETSQDIITCLSGYGSGDLSIREANPLGTSTIYDFTYYLNKDWMTENLIQAVKKWNEKVEKEEKTYADKYEKLKELYAKRDGNGKLTGGLLKLQNDLIKLKIDLKGLEYSRSAAITRNDKDAQKDVKDKTKKINEINKKIKEKQKEINNVNTQINKQRKELTDINNKLSFNNNFTKEEIKELDYFIFEGSYTNSNFVITKDMPTDEAKDMAKQLLERTRKELKRLSQPSFNFSMDVVNFLFIEKFKPFINEIKLGSLIHAEIKRDNWVNPILLEIDIDYENPENFTMTFGNKYRLETSQWTFKELFDQSKVTNGVSRNYSGILAPIKGGGLNDQVTKYMTSELNAANQEIISSENQEVTIGTYGIRGTKRDGNGNVDNHQIMITNNKICMTDDNWQTSKLAIGESTNGIYGVIAEQIVGNLIAGNNLTIQAGDGTNFKVDSNGVTLKNATLKIENKKNTILLDPKNGLKIKNKNKETVFEADDSGNLTVKSKMSAGSGTIGGFEIGKDYIRSKNKNIELKSDGTAKIGLLKVENDGKATFDGTIKANKIEGEIKNSQIQNNAITKNKINDNAITNSKIENNAITSAKIAGNAVGQSQIAPDAVNGDMIRTNVIRVKHVIDTSKRSGLDREASLDTLFAEKAFFKDIFTDNGNFKGVCSWTGKKYNNRQYTATIQNDGGLLGKGLLIQNNYGDVTIKVTKDGKDGPMILLDGNVKITGNIYNKYDREIII